MKKLIIMALLVAGATIANAACMNWQVNGAAGTVDYSVFFLLTDNVADSYSSISDIAALNGGSGEIAKISARAYGASGLIDDASLVKGSKLSMIIVNADATKYAVINNIDTTLVYDPNNQESSQGTFEVANDTITGASYQAFAVPEPTSGLLMLIGLAGLALRRRRA